MILRRFALKTLVFQALMPSDCRQIRMIYCGMFAAVRTADNGIGSIIKPMPEPAEKKSSTKLYFG